MPTIAEYLKYAETAFAAYANNLILGKGNALRYESADMSPTQAQRFDASCQVLGQQDLSDGFSAVLFQPVDTQGNPAGQKVLAIRGTESSHWGIDFLVDAINIAYLGTSAGMSQYASLENFYQSLIADGKLSASESIVTTGHSLGGFLAQAFTAKHDTVSASYTYNAPGFSVAPGVVTNMGTELLKLFGLSGTVPNEKIFNARAFDGISATAGLGQMIGSIQTFNIEATSNPVTNHSITTLNDALSIYAAYANLFPTADVATITTLLRQSSPRNATTLESSLDALRILLIDGTIATDAAKQTATGDRDAFYTNLYALQNNQNYKSLANTASLVSLSSLGASAGDYAKTDFGTLVALNYLLPFAIPGSGSVMIGVHADLYARWQADQTKRASGCADLNFSDAWLSDRSKMLGWLLQGNASDNLTLTDPNSRGFEQWIFDDKATGKSVTVLPNAAFAYAADKHYVAFASDDGQILNGDKLADHLYGGLGADTLNGKEGDDYIEGGFSGDDNLIGGTGDDVLFGDGSQSSSPDYYVLPQYHGNDILDGGDGDDLAANSNEWRIAV